MLDWFAFLWAETVIALCLIAVVLAGVRTGLRPDDEAEADGEEAGGEPDAGTDGGAGGPPGAGGTGDLGAASRQ